MFIGNCIIENRLIDTKAFSGVNMLSLLEKMYTLNEATETRIVVAVKKKVDTKLT